MDPEKVFDVEGDDEGNPSPAPEPVATAIPPRDADDVRRRPGRPRGPRVVPAPVPAGAGAPNIDISRREDEWPKEMPDLWQAVLDWGANGGRTAADFTIRIERLVGPNIEPVKYAELIYGEQVGGDDQTAAGDALIQWLTNVYHMALTDRAAKYTAEFRLRSNSTIIRKSVPFSLDSPDTIRRLRQRIATQQGRSSAPQNEPTFAPMPPAPRAYAGAPMPAPQQQRAEPFLTGDPYADRYIAHLRDMHERSEGRIAELESRIALNQPPPQATVQQPAPVDPDVALAKQAAMTAQAIVQALTAMGFKPQEPAPATPPAPAAPQPATPAQQQSAVNAAGSTIDTLDKLIEEGEKLERVKLRMRKFLGVPEEAEDEEDDETVTPTQVIVESPKKREVKSWTIPGTDLQIPRYEEDDDDVSFGTKVVHFFAMNPNTTGQVGMAVIQAAVAKLADSPALAGMLGQLLQQGGPGAVIAQSVARAAVNGSANGAGGGGGFSPPTA